MTASFRLGEEQRFVGVSLESVFKPTVWRGIRTRYSQSLSLVLYPLS